jgi:hypothetical protein
MQRNMCIHTTNIHPKQKTYHDQGMVLMCDKCRISSRQTNEAAHPLTWHRDARPVDQRSETMSKSVTKSVPGF